MQSVSTFYKALMYWGLGVRLGGFGASCLDVKVPGCERVGGKWIGVLEA